MSAKIRIRPNPIITNLREKSKASQMGGEEYLHPTYTLKKSKYPDTNMVKSTSLLLLAGTGGALDLQF